MFKKWIVTTIMIMSAILVTANHLSSLPVVIAETTGDDDDVDGEFEITGFNNPLNILEFDLKDENGSTVSTYNLNPSQWYTINLKVEDLDTMNDIYFVEFVFYHVPSGSSITQTFINTTKTSLDGSATVFRHNISDSFISYIEPDGSSSEDTSEDTDWGISSSLDRLIDPGREFALPVAGTTGNSVGHSNYIDTKDVNNNTVGSIQFNYEVSFRISKVANRAGGINTTSGAWYLGARIKDGRTPNNSSPSMITSPALAISATDPVNDASTPFTMNWYGEVEDLSGEKFDWSDSGTINLTPGAIDMTTQSGLYLDQPNPITFWSNDSHEITIKSSSTWDVSENAPLAKGVTQASIVSASTLTAPQTFAVRIAKRDAGFQNSEFLTTNELILRAPDETSATNEDGYDLRVDAWLGLAEEFQNGTYTGTITFTIKNP